MVFKSINLMHDLVFPFLGFGKSDKYTNPDNYTHELHCFTLRKLLDHLDVRFEKNFLDNTIDMFVPGEGPDPGVPGLGWPHWS